MYAGAEWLSSSVSQRVAIGQLLLERRQRYSSVLERHTRDREGCGFDSSPAGAAGEMFFPIVNFSVLTVTSEVSVPPPVSTVARKRPISLCQSCRWQVTASGCNLAVSGGRQH